ncbi:MAG: hypothetical protein Q8K58_15280, partial [Acidimicrobiales bacterium]|nr:hypothetical protein [Acidimicrobiales bacterium]
MATTGDCNLAIDIAQGVLDLDSVHLTVTLEDEVEVVCGLRPLNPGEGPDLSSMQDELVPSEPLQRQHLSLESERRTDVRMGVLLDESCDAGSLSLRVAVA